MTDAFDVFLATDAFAINSARLKHLVNLGLDLAGKRVLEVGAGIGLLSHPFEERGCTLLSTDGSARNIVEMRRRFPHRDCAVLDIDSPCDLKALGAFDIVFCYGTLYHLANPDRALRQLAAVCTGQLLLETIVLPGEANDLQLVRDPLAANQAIAGVGCRPTRSWVMTALRRHMGHAYATTDQPSFPDYVTDWTLIEHSGNLRAVFVGSRTELHNAKLADTPPQRCYPSQSAASSSELWIDAGAGDRRESLAWARRDDVIVHAFEPLSHKAAALAETAPANYIVHTKVVGLTDAMVSSPADRTAAAGSRPADVVDLAAGLPAEAVQATRLDSFLLEIGATRVERLKLGAFDSGFHTLHSLGERIQDIHCIQLEAGPAGAGVGPEAASPAELVTWLDGQGFELVRGERQSHEEDEGLMFERRDWPHDAPSETVTATQLYDFADAVAERGEARRDGERLWLKTGPQPWSYAVIVPPGTQIDLAGRLSRLKVRADVVVGRAQIGILDIDGDGFVATRTVSPDDDGVFWLDLPRSASPGALVIRTADGGSAQLTVQLLEISLAKPSPNGVG